MKLLVQEQAPYSLQPRIERLTYLVYADAEKNGVVTYPDLRGQFRRSM